MKNPINRMEECLQALIDVFIESVKNTDYSDTVNKCGRDYYWKWISTIDVADKLKIRPSILRPTLKKLENLGYVTSKRSPNWIRWAVKDIKGFEQYKFDDYYKKIPNETT